MKYIYIYIINIINIKENLSFAVFLCFKKSGLGDELIPLVVLVTTTAVVKEMSPPISRKPLSLR
jgi:hypothetical protein